MLINSNKNDGDITVIFCANNVIVSDDATVSCASKPCWAEPLMWVSGKAGF